MITYRFLLSGGLVTVASGDHNTASHKVDDLSFWLKHSLGASDEETARVMDELRRENRSSLVLRD
jgi:hypothetical protein